MSICAEPMQLTFLCLSRFETKSFDMTCHQNTCAQTYMQMQVSHRRNAVKAAMDVPCDTLGMLVLIVTAWIKRIVPMWLNSRLAHRGMNAMN